jgi:hypothetical protein
MDVICADPLRQRHKKGGKGAGIDRIEALPALKIAIGGPDLAALYPCCH